MDKLVTSQTHLTPEYFQGRLDEAQQFTDQNGRYDDLLTDPTFDAPDLEAFRTIAADGLYEEQQETRSDLLERDNSPYEELGLTYETTVSELAEAEHRLETITDIEDARKARFLAAARRVIELAPLAGNRASELASEKIRAIEHMDRENLRVRIGQLHAEIEGLEESLEVASQPWPLPKIIQAYMLDMENDVEESSVIIEDEIPIDPETHDVDSAIHRLIERHGITHGASVMLAALLIDNEDRIFLPQELGDVIYQDESHFEGMTEAEREQCKNQRVRRRLNQYEHVKAMLEDSGYVLQYGYRHFIDSATRKPVQRKRRIYRAVKQNEDKSIPTTFEETIDPNLHPEMPLPMVIARKVTPEHSHAIAEDKQRELDAKEQEKGLQGKIRSVITDFWDKELIPEDMETTITVKQIQIKLMRLDIPRRNLRQYPHLKSLHDHAHQFSPGNQTNAAEIVHAGIVQYISYRTAKSPKEENRVFSLIESELERFYDNLEDHLN